MKRYAKYVKAHQSLTELCVLLVHLPSPRTRFFNYIMKVTDLAPNTLKMVLCTTPSGIKPGKTVIRKLSLMLKVPEKVLFPDTRLAEGSLVSLYTRQSQKPEEYNELIDDICKVTNASRKTVVSWMYGRHTPKPYAQSRIAVLLDSSISHLFPSRGDTKSTNDEHPD